jgi:hypothetical protein
MHGTLRRKPSARAEKASEISEKSSEFSEAMRLVKLAAEPRPAGDSVKGAIRRASHILNWSESRTADYWYGEVRRIEAREMDALRAIERRQNLRFLESNYRKHIEQLSALRARLESRDRDFHAPDIAAITFLLDELRSALAR